MNSADVDIGKEGSTVVSPRCACSWLVCHPIRRRLCNVDFDAVVGISNLAFKWHKMVSAVEGKSSLRSLDHASMRGRIFGQWKWDSHRPI